MGSLQENLAETQTKNKHIKKALISIKILSFINSPFPLFSIVSIVVASII